MTELTLPNFYNSNFFEDLRYGAHHSATVIVPLILDWVYPKSVVDVGCGDGTWLSVFQACGINDILGLDGSYVQSEMLQIPEQYFMPKDLSQTIVLNRTFDLAISLEVAEHLPEESALCFVESLVKLSEVVLFSAALPHQGGTNHINEQWPNYWIALFEAQGYIAVDILRKRIWDNTDVEPWYAQNSFLFVRSDRLAKYPSLQDALTQTSFFGRSVVQPTIYLQKCSSALSAPQSEKDKLEVSQIIQILGVTLHPSAEIQSGEALTIQITYLIKAPVEAAIFTLSLSKEDGTVLLDTETLMTSLLDQPLIPSYIQLQIDRLDLVEGNYFINPGIFSIDWTQTYDFQWHHYSVIVRSAKSYKGLFQPPMRWHSFREQVQES